VNKANQITWSGYDKWKRNVLRRWLNIVSDGADVTCGGRLFQKVATETGKARLPTVEKLNSGTASWLVEQNVPPFPLWLSVINVFIDWRAHPREAVSSLLWRHTHLAFCCCSPYRPSSHPGTFCPKLHYFVLLYKRPLLRLSPWQRPLGPNNSTQGILQLGGFCG